jgi:hypothetical protein
MYFLVTPRNISILFFLNSAMQLSPALNPYNHYRIAKIFLDAILSLDAIGLFCYSELRKGRYKLLK